MLFCYSGPSHLGSSRDFGAGGSAHFANIFCVPLRLCLGAGVELARLEVGSVAATSAAVVGAGGVESNSIPNTSANSESLIDGGASDGFFDSLLRRRKPY